MNFSVREIKSGEHSGLMSIIRSIFPGANVRIREGDTVFVCEMEGEIIAFSHFSKAKGRILLNGLGVKEEFRGVGVGTALLDESLKLLPRDLPIYLKVKATNDPAIAVYVKNGFFQKKYGNVQVMVKMPEN